MKNTRLAIVFIGSLLAALFMGCVNPASLETSPEEVPAGETPAGETQPHTLPFSYTVIIEDQEGEPGPADSRAVVGPPATVIPNIFNIVQIVALNGETKKIAGFSKARRKSDTETEGTLTLNIPLGNEYHFLMLFGYWERSHSAEGADSGSDYVYKSEPPTLLAVGRRTETAEAGKLTLTVWPLVIDTAFIADDPDATRIPETGKTVSLLSDDWTARWTVSPQLGLGWAQEEMIKGGGSGASSPFKSGTGILGGNPGGDFKVDGDRVDVGLGEIAAGIAETEREDSVNFNRNRSRGDLVQNCKTW
jgi:hypothetical protein